MPRQRRYGSQKTTSPQGKKEYQKFYFRDYRKLQNLKPKLATKAIEQGKPDLARQILEAKPKTIPSLNQLLGVNIAGQPQRQKPVKPKKKGREMRRGVLV